jgi:hypothetical protein
VYTTTRLVSSGLVCKREKDAQGEVGVDTPVAQLLAHVDQEYLQLLGGLLEDACKDGQAKAREVADDIGVCPHTEFLRLGVLGPAVLRPLEQLLSGVLEAGSTHL